MKKADLIIGDRVTLNFKKATANAKNQIFVLNVERKIEDVKKLGTGYFLVDQITESGIWLVAESMNIGDICVTREALRRARKK